MRTRSVRRALYVLFGRLLAGAPDAALYERLLTGGLRDLAAAQQVELTADLLDESDAEAAAAELAAEFDRLCRKVSLRASDYRGGTEDPVVAIEGFLREHGLRIDPGAELPADHLSVLLGIMGELSEQAEGGGADTRRRARAFFRRHLEPWALHALAQLAEAADRRFYRGLAAMIAAYLESERRRWA